MKWTRWCIPALSLLLGCHATTGGHLELTVGERSDISLPYTSGTGYTWSLEPAASDGLAHVSVSRSARDPATADLLGGPGQSHWTVEGRSAGRALLLFTYRRPWETDMPPARTRRVAVQVQ